MSIHRLAALPIAVVSTAGALVPLSANADVPTATDRPSADAHGAIAAVLALGGVGASF
jgi:hypothetical protein